MVSSLFPLSRFWFGTFLAAAHVPISSAMGLPRDRTNGGLHSSALMILQGTAFLPVACCGRGWGWAKPFRSTVRTRSS